MSEAPSILVVGGRGAKREKTRMVPVAKSLLEVDEDLLLSLGDRAGNLPPACCLGPGEPLIPDVRFHKPLTYLLEINTHYGAPF